MVTFYTKLYPQYNNANNISLKTLYTYLVFNYLDTPKHYAMWFTSKEFFKSQLENCDGEELWFCQLYQLY